MRRILLITTFALLGLAGPAQAGSYDVVACDPFAGNVNRSWTLLNDNPNALAATDCSPGAGASKELGAFDKIPGPPYPTPGQGVRWRFAAPAGTTITRLNGAIRVERNLGEDWSAAVRRGDGTVLLACELYYGQCGAGAPAGGWALSTSAVELGVRCDAPSGSCGVGSSLHTAAVYAREIKVTLSESTVPALGQPAGSLWADGYLPRTGSVTVGATDATGIREARLYVDDRLVARAPQACDFTRPVPCTDQPSMTLTPPALEDGTHTLRVTAVDAAGNEAPGTSRTVTVDRGAPSFPQDLKATGTGPGFLLSWTNPDSQVAPIAGATVEVCPRASTTGCSSRYVPGADLQQAGIDVPGHGLWTARVLLRDSAGNEDPARANVVDVDFADPAARPATTQTPTTAPPADETSVTPATDHGRAGGPAERQPPSSTPDPAAAQLRIASARRRGRRLVVTGTIAPSARGAVLVSFSVRVGRRTRTVSARATIAAGRWTTRLSLPAGATKQPGRLTARVDAASGVAPATATRLVARGH